MTIEMKGISRMGRTLGIAFGLGTHVLFAITVWYLFQFLKDGAAVGEAALIRDGLLALQFGVIHSFILLPATRRRLSRWIPAGLYGCFFCAVTCLSLLATIAYWRASPTILWSLAGWHRTLIQAGFLAAWAGLLYSLSLTGLGYQTGWTPFCYWLRGQPLPRREFVPRGAYRFFRHPVYLSFLGLVWLTPRMSLDHAVLTGIWTAYIFYGSYLKDRRLIHYLGDSYRTYQARVPGYPLLRFGPLGKVRTTEAEKVA
jgi:methanethiol S-methyltransferase